jgi:hypothetical protein
MLREGPGGGLLSSQYVRVVVARRVDANKGETPMAETEEAGDRVARGGAVIGIYP